MPTTLSPITVTIPAFTVTPAINTSTFPEDIDVYNTELPGVISAQATLKTQLNTLIGQLGTLESNVESLEASTISASSIAEASAHFMGTWVNQITVIPQSWQFNGLIYMVLIPGSTSPITDPSHWFAINTASAIKNVPAGNITATTVQSALNELDSEKAMAGNIPVDTHAATSKTTPVDADEFPIADSAATFGLAKLTFANLKATLKTYFDGIYANLSSPTFTGTPSLPTGTIAVTQTAGDNSTKVATTAFAMGAGGLPRNSQTFTSSGTFTVPAGVTQIMVQVAHAGAGGGGGGSSSGSGNGGDGGGGAASVFGTPKLLSVTPAQQLTLVIGAGGAGGIGGNYDVGSPSGSTGGTGGTSSFAAYLIAGSTAGGAGGIYTNSVGFGNGGGGGGVVGGAGGLAAQVFTLAGQAGSPATGGIGFYYTQATGGLVNSSGGGAGGTSDAVNGSAGSGSAGYNGGAGGAGGAGQIKVYW